MDDVVGAVFVAMLGAEGLLDVVDFGESRVGVNVFDTEEFFHFMDAGFGDAHLAGFFVDFEIFFVV